MLSSQFQINRDEETEIVVRLASFIMCQSLIESHGYGRYQQMAQERLVNQQQQQLQQQHSQSHQGATLRRELKNAHIYNGDTPTLIDVFMPRDDALDTEDDEMDVTDHELQEFKHLFMNNSLENCPKVTVRVNLSELTLKKT